MYDVMILGSGPAGLSAAIYASRAGLSFAVIEKDYMGTGQIVYTEQVDNYLGYCGIDGFSLGEKFREHAEALGKKSSNSRYKSSTSRDITALSTFVLCSWRTYTVTAAAYGNILTRTYRLFI